jgi:ABC-type spermidine/putrescine transport system permease subunit I
MSEEAENGGGSLKSIFIGLISTVTLAVGGYVTKQLTGEEEAAPAATTTAAPVININQAAAAPAPASKTIIVNKAAAGSTQAAPAPKPKAPTAKEELEKAPAW